MKHIVKGREPAEVAEWRASNAPSPQSITYKDMPKTALRRALLNEQGYLCGYTMLRIEAVADGHIEHIVPQSQSPVLATDYLNIVYCYPGDDVSKCPYGAGRKGGEKITDDNFLSPLDPTCETRLAFARNGAVSATGDAARYAIETLNLNHNVLVRARRAAIAKLPINKTRHPLTAEQAKHYATDCLEKNAKGRYLEFAVALFQIMIRYAQQRSAR